jgi:hypothetical protein
MAAAVTFLRCTDTSTRPSFPRNHSWMPYKATTVDATCLERTISALRRIAIPLDFIMKSDSSLSACCARERERDRNLGVQQVQNSTSCLRGAGSSAPRRVCRQGTGKEATQPMQTWRRMRSPPPKRPCGSCGCGPCRAWPVAREVNSNGKQTTIHLKKRLPCLCW